MFKCVFIFEGAQYDRIFSSMLELADWKKTAGDVSIVSVVRCF